MNFFGFSSKLQCLWVQSEFKTAAEMLLKMKKNYNFWNFRGIFHKFQFLENFELSYGSIFLNETFSIDLALILKNNQHELDGNEHHFMPDMPIFQKMFFFSKKNPKI